MEMGPRILDNLLMPSAAFSAIECDLIEDGSPKVTDSWSESCINPINMLDHLPLPSETTSWRIDGGEGHARRFFAVPNFARSSALLRIDVFLPPFDVIRRPLREALQLEALFWTKSSDIPGLPIAQYLAAGLEHWTSVVPEFQLHYESMPFGSHLLVTKLTTSIARLEFALHPNYDLEARMLSLPRLKAAWDLPADRWPPAIDVAGLEIVRQPHESISLVRLRQDNEGRIHLFKSTAEDPKYLYNELRVLLSMAPHPNIIGAPLFVVTKRCRFGGKVAVCGFILAFYTGGSLRERLRRETSGHVWLFKDKLRCAQQITSAIKHITEQPPGFYSDLKLDNVVFASDEPGADAVLIDFEQRGAAYAWEPPEIFSVDILDWVASFCQDYQTGARYRELLQRCLPGWRPRTSACDPHTAQLFNTPWLALHIKEREAAQVFMLGKVLWCMFEGVPELHGVPDMSSLQYEQVCLQRFPRFRGSPNVLRQLVLQCTMGAPEHQDHLSPLVVWSGKIYPSYASTGEPQRLALATDTHNTAKTWWQEQLAEAERYLCHRYGIEHECDNDALCANVDQLASERPEISSVLETLKAVQKESDCDAKTCE